MGCPMMRSHSGPGTGAASTPGWPSPLFVPAPMAAFGVLIALMFGMTLGMLIGSKRAKHAEGGELAHGHGHGPWQHGGPGSWQGKGWQGKPWMRGGMPHHHHGTGGPPCRCDEPQSDAAPDAGGTEA